MNNPNRRTSDLSTAEKRALLEQILRNRASKPKAYPLSYAQQRLWFLDQWEPGSPLYNVPIALRLTGRLHLFALQRCFDTIVQRHHVLRATFAMENGQPAQIIAPHLDLPLQIIDLTAINGSLAPEGRMLQEDALQRCLEEEGQKPFDLYHGPLLRTVLIRLAEQEHVLIVTLHHIISDIWSTRLLFREVAALYQAFTTGNEATLPPLPIQYTDFATWQRQWLEKPGKGGHSLQEIQLAYWQEQLADIPPVLELPTDHPRPAVQSFRGTHRTFILPTTVSQQIQALSRQERVTPFMILLAAFQLLLARYSGQDDIVVGTPVSNRNRTELEPLIGCFVNTLVLRTRIVAQHSVRDLLRQVREVTLAAHAHQDLPFEQLIEALEVERDPGRNPLFQVMFVLQNAAQHALEIADLSLQPIVMETGTAKFDLSLIISESTSGFEGDLDYNEDLFEPESIDRLIEHFQTLLAALVSDASQQLSLLPILNPQQADLLLTMWNQTQCPYPAENCIHTLFEQRVPLQPDAIALSFEGQQLSYQALDQRANQLARRLQQLGVGPEVCVGLGLERSLELVIGLLAILKAGGAYLPLDPAYPQERLALMLRDTHAPLLLTQQALYTRWSSYQGRRFCLDAERLEGTEPLDPPQSGVQVSNLAYVIYTSGSTGQPKGSLLSHQGLGNLALAQILAFALTSQSRVLQGASLSFDAAVSELFTTLLSGATLVLCQRSHLLPGAAFLSLLREQAITVATLPPSLLSALPETSLETLQTLVMAGEAATASLVQRFARPHRLLLNAYGPSEASVCAALGPCLPHHSGAPAIGRPLANVQLYVLDASLQPVPVGAIGELFIGGVGLSRGYLHQPELTAERFVPHPWSQQPGARLYRSGDLVRWRAGGELEYVGRRDGQVKVRGHRIELAEIEAILSQHPAVRQAIVLANHSRTGERRKGADEKQLVAYIVMRSGMFPSLTELRAYLHERLPEYMLPAIFMFLEALPLLPNGKLDRRALPAPTESRPSLEKAYVAARTPLEQYLVEVWQRVLGLRQVGIHDNFFELGGDSIKAAITINQIQERLSALVYVVALFDAPTIAGLALYLGEHFPDAIYQFFGAESLPADALARLTSALTQTVSIGEKEVEQLRAAIAPLAPAPAHLSLRRKNPPAIFVLSPPRSGSTLLRVMLAGHPELFAPPELELLSFQTLSQRASAFAGRNAFWLEGLVRAVMELRGCDAVTAQQLLGTYEREQFSTHEMYRLLQQWAGARRLVEKTPAYALDPHILTRMEHEFEQPLYLHLLRHPASMIDSFEQARLDEVFFRHPHAFERRDLAELIWLLSHRNILHFLQHVPAHRQMRLSFEALVQQPEAVMRQVCAFLHLPFDAALLTPYEGQRMTDGIHPLSHMIGDVKFHEHRNINASRARISQEGDAMPFLSELTWQMAQTLGYERVGNQESKLATVPALPPLRARGRSQEPVPLSYAQQRLWFLAQWEPQSAFYHIASAIRLQGPLHMQALERSLQEIIRRHDALRTTFVVLDGEPTQRIALFRPRPLPLIDLGEMTLEAQEDQVQLLVQQEGLRPFDMARGPLLRFYLLRLSLQKHILLLTIHHSIADGWSMGLLQRELVTLYTAFSRGEPSPLVDLPLQYTDYAIWQRQWLQGKLQEQLMQYWRNQLANAPTLLELPADHPRPAIERFQGAIEGLALPYPLTEELRQMSQQEGATLFMLLLTAFQVLLARYSGQDDILVGTPIAGRTRAEVESLIGNFVNTLVLRANLTGQPSFHEALSRVREMALGAYTHQELPFEQLVEVLQPERSTSHAPLFQVMFVWQNVPGDKTQQFPDLEVSELAGAGETAKFDLTFFLWEGYDGLRGAMEYNRDLFEAATIKRMLAHYHSLLEGIVHHPEQAISRLPLLIERERQQLLLEWNNTCVQDQPEQLFAERFAAWVEETPDAIALVCKGEQLTYQQLHAHSLHLADCLQDLGVASDMVVALLIERGLALVTTILSVFQAGGAYLPLDPQHPPARLRHILGQSKVQLVLTAGDLMPGVEAALAELPQEQRPQVQVVETLLRQNRLQQRSPETTQAGPRQLAYVIYTSGSTGLPKGAMIEQSGMLNHLDAKISDLRLTGSDAVAQTASQCFDISVWQMLAVLLVGGRVEIFPDETSHDPQRLLSQVEERAVSVLETVPSLLQAMLEDASSQENRHPPLAALRWLMPTGEALSPTLCRSWLFHYPHVPLINAYGPTECSDDVTHYPVTQPPAADLLAMPIGKPISNTRLYVLDKQLELVPIGVYGELYVGGRGVGRGYLHEGGRTAESFIPDSFSQESGARLYKTGDIVRYLPDGIVEYHGRADFQVKVRGYRIELGEIEAVLRQHAAISEAIVTVHADNQWNQRLVAYVVGDQRQVVDTRDLQSFLQQHLPDYMVPSAFVQMEALPLTPNGKLDRQALPAPDWTHTRDIGLEQDPRTAIEELLLALWSQVLHLERVGIHENFFEIGGHSLLATQLIARIRDAFAVELPLRSLFMVPTIARLTEHIEDLMRSKQGLRVPPIIRARRDRALPLSFTQRRLWFLDQWQPESPFYTIPLGFRLSGQLQIALIERGLNRIIRRHEILRTTFVTTEGYPAQSIAAHLKLFLPVIDVSGLDTSGEQDQAELQHIINEEIRKPFNLRYGPLLRAKLIRLTEQEHILLLSMHHIIADGWSMRLLFQELVTFYNAASSDMVLPDLTIQYADYAAWQQQWLGEHKQDNQSQSEIASLHDVQLAYWKKQLADAPATLELPTDHPRPAVQSFRGAHQTFYLTADLSRRLHQLSRQEGVTFFMIALAAFQLLLARYSGQDDIVVGTPVANRSRTELEPLIGCFVNTLVLRTRIVAQHSVRDLLRQVREVTLAAHAHQDLPFEQLIEALEVARDPSRNPLFQVMLLVQNTPTEVARLSNLTVYPVEMEIGTVKFDLVLSLEERPEGIEGQFGYNLDLFEPESIDRLIEHFQALLEALVQDAEQPLAALSLLSPAQAQLVLQDWNQTQRPYPAENCIHTLFEQRVPLQPDAIALSFEGQQLSYQALDQRANQLARHLQQFGVGPEVCVGLGLERSLELVIGLLAILKAGGAYLPLDPAYPQPRLALMLRDTHAPLLLTRHHLQACFTSYEGIMLSLENSWPEAEVLSTAPPESGVGPANLAYVIYTSGSTGQPKGSLLSHQGLGNLALAQILAFALTPQSRVLQGASLSFDAAVSELFTTLLSGATLVLCQRSHLLPGAAFLSLLREQAITVATLPPSLLSALPETSLETLQTLVMAGEAATASLVQRFARPHRLLLNAYGPSEASVCAALGPCLPHHSGAPAIGRPLANVQLYVLDASLQPVPVGAIGELFIGGVGLSRGYLHQPELTAERFVPHPWSQQPGARLYRSGDLVRWRAGGELEYVGRHDGQVKVRGYRIELAEIEAILSQHPAVRQAIVMLQKDQDSTDSRLIAYLVAHTDTSVTGSVLRSWVQERLPEYMLPAIFMFLEALPLLPNGKLDRRALPTPEDIRKTEQKVYMAPRTALERYLVHVWRDILRLDTIGIHDNFFELGGDSIKAAITINQIQERLSALVYVVALFDAPTIAGLALYLGEHFPDAISRLFGIESLSPTAQAHFTPLPFTGHSLGEKGVKQLQAAIAPLAPAPAHLSLRRKNPPAIFVLSPPRSGSTLLRVMLAGHPELFAPPELELLSFQTLSQRASAFAGRNAFWLEGLVRAVMELWQCDAVTAQQLLGTYEQEQLSTHEMYRLLQQWAGTRRLVEKTPAYALDPHILTRMEHEFEQPLYLHLLRHPASMIDSFEQARLDEVFFRHPHAFGRRDLAELIWLLSHRNILHFLQQVPQERQMRLSFEALVQQPEAVMRQVCAFLHLPFDAALLTPYEGQRMTDGIHPLSRMIGDIKFHEHQGIDASRARISQEGDAMPFLSKLTWQMAQTLGYERTGSTPGNQDQDRLEIPALSPLTARRQHQEPVPLSYAQQRLWFLAQWEPQSAYYHISSALQLSGRLAIEELKYSFQEIVRRHAILRTTIAMAGDGNPVQIIAPELSLSMPVIDLRGCWDTIDGETKKALIKGLSATEAQRPFDLGHGPLLRITLIRCTEHEHVLLLTMHHIISDGWSMSIFYQELARLYTAFKSGHPSPLPEVPLQYADFALWQRQRLQGETLDRLLTFWREQLADIPTLLELPTDRPRPAVQTLQGAHLRFSLPVTLSKQLQTLAQREGATLFMTLLAGFQALLYRYTGQEQIAVGTPIAGRTRAEVEGLIGCFINTLVLPARINRTTTFSQLLSSVRETALGAYTHQEMPFEQLVEALQPERDLSHTPLFQVMFVLQNAPTTDLELDDVELRSLPEENTTSKFDLTLVLEQTEHAIVGAFEYNTVLFDATTIQCMQSHLITLLEGVVAQPHGRISEMPLLTDAEWQQMLQAEPASRTLPLTSTTLQELFEAQVKRIPDSIVVSVDTEQLTYRALNRKANQLAHYLRTRGVGPETLVGICMERSLDQIIGLLGILKAGGAYVPLDPTYPAERLAFLLADASISLLVTQQSLAAGFPTHNMELLCLDTSSQTLASEQVIDPLHQTQANNLAYVIYTSGSTGKPKGVQITHANAVNLFQSTSRDYHFHEGDVWALFHSSAFDFSVWEMWGAFLSGGRLAVVPYWTARSPEAFYTLLSQQQVTVLNQTPSAFYALMQAEQALTRPRLLALRYVIFGGEALDISRLHPWQEQHGDCQIVNMYGITETTVHVTYRPLCAEEIEATTRSIIGHPIAHVQVYVLDRQMQPLPAGVPGELYIGGAGLARGYLQRPELTAERFVPNPFSAQDGSRLYRSGDLVRLLHGGELEYLGRVDEQVKIRGFRIEPGEIAATLEGHPGIQQALVLAHHHTLDDNTLIAAVVLRRDELPEEGLRVGNKVTEQALRSMLREHLPEYMVPSSFLLLETFPLTAHGKVDRSALLALCEGSNAEKAGYAAPQTPTEETLADIWAQVLRRERVGRYDNFFDLGGHSLLATQIILRIRTTFQVELPLQSVFITPTLNDLAARIETAQPQPVRRVPSIKRLPRTATGS